METFTVDRIATMIGRDRRAIGLVLSEVKPDSRKGRTPEWTLKTAFNALLADAQHRAVPKNKLDERQLLLKEKRIAAQRENRLASGEVFTAEEIKHWVQSCAAMFREKCLSLPGQLQADLSGDPNVEPLVRRRVYECLNELADWKTWDQ
jgi:hypothetical protein